MDMGTIASRPPTNNDNNEAKSPMNKMTFKCQKCNLLFDSVDAASSHEETEHAHICGICKVLRFQTIQELSNHKRTCGDMIINSGDDVDKDNDAYSSHGSNSFDAVPKSLAGVPSGVGSNANDEKAELANITNDPGTKIENNSEWLTVWTCDICKEAQFESYDAAVEHEKSCKGPDALMKPKDQAIGGIALPSSKTSLPPPSPLKRKNDVPSTDTKANILFSPIISDRTESLQYRHKISSYHRTVLESLQLQHRPSRNATGERLGIGSFHCLFCSKKISPPDGGGDGIARDWSMFTIVNELPATVFAHLREDCKPEFGAKCFIFECSQSSGDEFEKFLLSFFAENGITVLPDVGGIVVLHDDDFMNNPQ